MNTSDSNRDDPNERPDSELESSISSVVEDVLEQLQKGSPVDFQAVNQKFPELQPALRSRLATLRRVFEMAEQAQHGDPELTEASPARVGIESNGDLSSGNSPGLSLHKLNCPHCGVGIKVIGTNDDVTCRNCGSSVQVNSSRPLDSRSFTLQLRQVGRFELREVVGTGGFGIVYRAIDTELGRSVAIKLPREGTFGDNNDEQRFLREARHVAKLTHPNIVPIYEIGRDTDSPYLVSKFIDGLTLTDLINHRRVDSKESATLMAKVADAVAYAHEKKIIHRDLKPGNVLLDHDLEPYVTDFGLAREEDGGDFTITMEGQVIGTPSYMSPEQIQGDSSKVGPLSDVYSLGVIFYRMLTGELPFRGSKRLMLHQIQYQEPREPRTLNDNIPTDFQTIALKAMAKEPAKRYASAADFASDLRNAVDGKPISARPASRSEKLVRLCRRYPLAATLASLLFLTLLLLAVGGITWGNREKSFRTEVENQKDSVQLEKERTQFQLARNLASRGIDRLNSGDQVGALPWLASAFQVESENESRDSIHRIRLGTILDSCPHLVSVIADASGVAASIFDPTNQRIGAGFRNGRIVVWEVGQDSPIVDQNELAEITAMCFSPDGVFFAAASKQGEAIIWNIQSGEQIARSRKHTGFVTRIQFAADSSFLASSSRDKTARIWRFQRSNNASGKGSGKGSEQDLVLNHETDVVNLLLGPDDKRLFTVEMLLTSSSVVNVWNIDPAATDEMPDVQPSKPVATYSMPDGVRSLSMNSSLNAVVGRYFNRGFFTLGSGKGQDESEAPQPKSLLPDQLLAKIRYVASNDSSDEESGQFIAVAKDGSIKTLSWPSGELVDQVTTSISTNVAAISWDGSMVALADNYNKVHIWDVVRSATVCSPIQHSGRIDSVEFSRNGKYLLSGGPDGLAKVWDLNIQNAWQSDAGQADQEAKSLDIPKGHSHFHGTVSASGKLIAVSNDAEHRQFQIAETATGKVLHRVSHEHSNGTMAFSNDDKHLIVAFSDGVARVFDVLSGTETGEQYQVNSDPDYPTTKFALLAFSIDDKRVIGAEGKSLFDPGNRDTLTLRFPDSITVSVWDRESGDFVAQMNHDNNLLKMELSDDGTFIATSCYDKSARTWKLEDGNAVTDRLHDGLGNINDLDFDDSSQLLATAVDDINTVFVWDLATNTVIDQLLLKGTPTKLIFQTRQRVVVATNQGNLEFWNPAAGNEEGEQAGAGIDHRQRSARLFGTSVLHMEFSPNQGWLLTTTRRPNESSTDERWNHSAVQIWDPATLELVAVFSIDERISNTFIDSVGTSILTTDPAGTVSFWRTVSDSRSVTELEQLASVLSGYRIDASGTLVPLTPNEFTQAWNLVRNKHPETSSVGYSPTK